MLSIVALPIGNPKDITLRALEALHSAELIIGEEKKELFPILKEIGIDIHTKKFEFLNEHTHKNDIEYLKSICKEKNVALVSDCGTPVFCDPGSLLIHACRSSNITIQTLPGASSLMTLISLSSQKLDQFLFYGFLPRDKNEKETELQKLSKNKIATVLMDTPYRMKTTMEAIHRVMPERRALLGCNLTTAEEQIFEGKIKDICPKITTDSAEFILLLYPI